MVLIKDLVNINLETVFILVTLDLVVNGSKPLLTVKDLTLYLWFLTIWRMEITFYNGKVWLEILKILTTLVLSWRLRAEILP